MSAPTPSRERGTLLLPVAVFVILVAGLSLGLLYEGLAERTAVAHTETSIQALDIAEAGIVQAEMEIFALEDLDGGGVGIVAGELGEGAYVVQSERDGAFPDRWRLVAEGERGLSIRRIELGVRRRADEAFVEGLFGRDGVVFSGNGRTDSYDSGVGTYDDQAVNLDSGGRYANTRGHIGSNGSLRLNGSSAWVRGNAIPGELYDLETSGSPIITGDTVPRRLQIPIEDPAREDFVAAYNDNENLTLMNSNGGQQVYRPSSMSVRAGGGADVTLRGGTYFFTDVQLTGGSRLVVTRPTTIYVIGDLDLAGGTVVNQSGVPSDLRIVQHPYAINSVSPPQRPRATITGGAGAAFALYAPQVDVVLRGDEHFYGAVVGASIDLTGNAHFHYDESLAEEARMGRVVLERLYWRELARPVR